MVVLIDFFMLLFDFLSSHDPKGHVILFYCIVFNATFSNISAISWRPVLVVEEARVPERTTDDGQATGKLYHMRLRGECTLFCNLQRRARIGDSLV